MFPHTLSTRFTYDFILNVYVCSHHCKCVAVIIFVLGLGTCVLYHAHFCTLFGLSDFWGVFICGYVHASMLYNCEFMCN